ncbi:MAG: 7-cyano-7-deazaguanine synthase QueC [Acidobacteria bacterium]|nr:7-cyano-7-deazaguanine synthase QueC [Acidobacteriota bacterium]
MPRAVVLLSGGLDSYTAAALTQREGFELYALSINYGQRHAMELHAARAVGRALAVTRHVQIDLDLSRFGGSALTADIEVPKDRSLDDSSIPVTYVPARNTIFLSLALGWAEVVGASHIVLGVNALDYSGYPDCRPDFVRAFERLATFATRAGVEGHAFTVSTPLIDMTKAAIIAIGASMGLDYGITRSCYDPATDGRPCEHCDSCRLRARGFAEAGVRDPLLR